MSQRGMEFLMSLNSVLSLSDLLQSLDQYKSRQTVNVRYVISRHFPKHDYNRCQAVRKQHTKSTVTVYRVDCRLAPSQREMSLQSNAVFQWLGASLESTLCIYCNTHIVFFLNYARESADGRQSIIPLYIDGFLFSQRQRPLNFRHVCFYERLHTMRLFRDNFVGIPQCVQCHTGGQFMKLFFAYTAIAEGMSYHNDDILL